MKKKVIVLVSILGFFALSLTALASFYFNEIINGDAYLGKISIVDRYYYEYNYSPVTSGVYNPDTLYYEHNSSTDTYNLITVTYATFVTDGTLFTYDYSTIQANENRSINCYANKKSGLSSENNYPYLNQIGYKFNFKSSIDVYLRLEIKDTWKSQKVYITTGKEDTKYILKDKIEGESPFKYQISEDWIFDASTDCLYYKYVIPATCEDINDSRALLSNDYFFRVNPDYWYDISENIAYREMVIIELSFNVSLVQANRAEKKWGISFADLGISSTTK